MIRVGWIFSLVRSGSSAAAYGAAAPWKLGIADEPFGPWIRTRPPHAMPATQQELVRAFRAVGHTLSADVVGIANRLFAELAERDASGKGRVICKCPHLLFTPDEFETWFGTGASFNGTPIAHHAVYLIRNPVRRVNSAYSRRWEHVLNDPFELEIYRTFMQRWKRAESRVRYDDLRREPTAFFRDLHRSMGFGSGETDAEDAAAEAAHYVRTTYHASSGETSDDDPMHPISESGWHAPREALDVYLADDEIRSFMGEQGWPTHRSAYEPGPLRSLWRRVRSA
ncbi:MAG: hypothetical protein AAGB48_03715 [Planctomycetota bacterium]